MKLEPRIEAARIDDDTVEIKQYIGDELLTTSRFFADATQKVLAMQFHPKCGECRHYLAFDNGLGECNNAKQTYRCDLTPTDYCRHWEGKG